MLFARPAEEEATKTGLERYGAFHSLKDTLINREYKN